MKIYLFLADKLYEFDLSKDPFGSFSFDFNPDEENKLIHIEAENNQWVLYSTDDVKIMFDGVPHNRTLLRPNSFYVLIRNDIQYLIYVADIRFCKIFSYKYDQNIKLNIGNSDSSNIKYNCPYVNGKNVSVNFKENQFVLENPEHVVLYVDKKFIPDTTYKFGIGSELFIYGLNILFLNSVLLIKDVNGLVSVVSDQAGIVGFNMPLPDKPENINIKDVDLYKVDDYFSKSPRLRRIIETKEIKLTEPPQTNKDSTPLLLTLGPMFTMGLVSVTNFLGTISRIQNGQATVAECKTELITEGAMLASMLLWPLMTQLYNKVKQAIDRKRTFRKYMKYLNQKRVELDAEKKLQKEILLENLISVDECAKIAWNRSFNFWDKRLDQSDLLEVRVGIGNEDLDVKIEYPDKEFSMEEGKLKKAADKLVNDFKYIEDVPIKYSFSQNKITAVMGNYQLTQKFMNNVLLQLLTFYSYEDLKVVTFTSDKNKSNWDYLKYFNHSFTNERNLRFFASEGEEAKIVCEYLDYELNSRLSRLGNNNVSISSFQPYYFIIIDNYDMVKRSEFIKRVTEIDNNIGFSIVLLENRMNRLPSKCNNFINLNEGGSTILLDAFEKQKHKKFKLEINENVNMYTIARSLSNVPIEFAEGLKELPDAITFLEMEKVGKVEQLNILNRWNTNDATQSLKAEVGVDEQGEFMYLDLHEKFHGPHGLIAGTTGSGKSEFIITYILSLSMNYSPDDVAFILIDYKGGGLAFAFENKLTGVTLPHLAGTITNLDKAEMHRTLVSIDSEVKRRQRVFNEARDKMGESTIDIYKYQRLYKEGHLDEPVPHLFIICDEFAELKSQQPDFMDNLISIARIGRSLGVHLILATQKPSGVVDDQIWSNTKFRVCLKVADEADSKEMLKRPEAAMIKQAGRFYLQVGMDEIFALGQSGWCGAKYYPSDKPVKQVDKSLNFINNPGMIIKSIQASSGNTQGEAQGEQLAAIMKNIIEVSEKTGKKVKRLWLENIPDIILADQLYEKYNFKSTPYNIDVIYGEYDAPEKQEQGVANYNYIEDGNLIIYGMDGTEKENFLGTLLYSTSLQHSPDEINFYIIDYGSESLRRFKNLPHVGDMVFSGEDEKYTNLIKMINNEIKYRKKLFSDYGGEYNNYIKNAEKKLPIKVFVINNFDSIIDAHNEIFDDYPDMIRDSSRYGIIFIFTASASNSVPSKIAQNFNKFIAFRVKDSSDYQGIFDSKNNVTLKEVDGRGIIKHDILHEFQAASIVEDADTLNDFMIHYIKEQNTKYNNKAKGVPRLPDVVDYDYIKDDIDNLTNVPIGVYRKELDVARYDFLQNIGTMISSNRAANMIPFVEDLVKVFFSMNMNTIVIDGLKKLKIDANSKVGYYNNNFDEVLEKSVGFVQQLIDSNSNAYSAIIIFGLDKMIGKLEDDSQLFALTELLKKYEKVSLIIVDDGNKLKKYAYEAWFTSIFTNTEGIWIGKGIIDQGIYQISSMDRELQKDIKNNMGYIVSEGYPYLLKFIEFGKEEDININSRSNPIANDSGVDSL